MLYLYRKKEKGIPILIAALRPASLIKTKVFFLFHSSRHKNQLFQQKKNTLIKASHANSQTHRQRKRNGIRNSHNTFEMNPSSPCKILCLNVNKKESINTNKNENQSKIPLLWNRCYQ